MVTEPFKYFQDEANPPPWMKALAEVRQLATREAYCYAHVQAIIVAVDQYAEAALGSREYMPHNSLSAYACKLFANRSVRFT